MDAYDVIINQPIVIDNVSVFESGWMSHWFIRISIVFIVYILGFRVN